MPDTVLDYKNTESLQVRTHRVGTITTGLCFIGYGAAFLLHTTLGLFTYESILAAWPLILIALGVEVLLASSLKKNFVYDKAGAFMMIIMGFFSMSMAIAEICIKHAEMFR
ncbi:LiaF transmembrane domain-containing protein [Butyrivibrio sp. JL13D10]|uniref:LiaF transmembrane domain-containing protein n=1 Tax=Butyrivibrio sp. JL13D10 TaxID=3236815 RepID=UPI0038B609F4